ncbi:potassium channel family protein [Blastococcus sp. URHD0036]|uniref:potassium channel family protein n=1 Tax=Blastococcus sp. URHD0036 TaxID=1380356 RepID=UPI0009DD39AC|nr:potassium channel family protein [Blastococcus sp. URHD0036]
MSRPTPPRAVDVPPRRVLLRGAGRTLLSTAAVLVVYAAVPVADFTVRTIVGLALGIGVVAVLVVWQVRAILRARTPALRAVEALALSLPLFLVVFAQVYVVLSASEPAAFTEPMTRVDALYFVVTVFASVGFGDIAPVSQLARVLTTVQMILDLLVIGLVLRIVVAAVGRRRAEQPGTPADVG